MVQIRLSLRTLLVAILVIASAGVLYAVSPVSTSGQSSEPDEQWENVDDVRLAVKLEQSSSSVLPGEQIEYTATIENRTGERQANLSIQMVVWAGRDAVSYIPNSTSVRRADDRPFVPLGLPLSWRPTNVVETLESGQVVSIKWRMQISECTLRDRWVQVGIRALTDETEGAIDEVQAYILSHTDWAAAKHLSATHAVHPSRPSPGETVQHIINVVNDGHIGLEDVLVRVLPRDSIPDMVAEDVSFYIVRERGGTPSRSRAIDARRFSHPQGGFRLDYLNPGEVLVLSWTEYIDPGIPIGTALNRLFSISTSSWDTSPLVGDGFLVSPVRNDLSVEIETTDPGHFVYPGHFESTYLSGDLISMRITITNRTTVARDDLRVTLDLPAAVSYVDGSGAYATPRFRAENARRLPDAWVDDGAVLPTIESGDTMTITFKVKVRDDVSPQEDLDVHATLRSSNDPELHASTRVNVAREPDIEVSLRDEEPIAAGSRLTFNITVRNSGQVPLIGAKFGVAEACTGIDYVPGTLRIESESDRSVLRDDTDILQQQARGADISVLLGDGNLDPGETVSIRMTFQAADDLDPGSVAGPRFIVTAESTDTALVPWVRDGESTEIEIAEPVEPLVTAADFETVTTKILEDIQATTDDVQTNTDAIEDTADDIRDLAAAIKTTTAKTEGIADATAKKVDSLLESEIKGARPWGQGWSWAVVWGGFGVLASFLAGLLLALPAWAALKWLWRRWGRTLLKRGERLLPTLNERAWTSWEKLSRNARDWLNMRLRR